MSGCHGALMGKYSQECTSGVMGMTTAARVLWHGPSAEPVSRRGWDEVIATVDFQGPSWSRMYRAWQQRQIVNMQWTATMKMLWMKITRVAELTQMRTDQSQHLSDSYYEIKTVPKLREELYPCNPSYFRRWDRRIESWKLTSATCQDLTINKHECCYFLIITLGLTENLCSRWGTHFFSFIGTSLSQRKRPCF